MLYILLLWLFLTDLYAVMFLIPPKQLYSNISKYQLISLMNMVDKVVNDKYYGKIDTEKVD